MRSSPKNALVWNPIWKLGIVLSNPSVPGYDVMGGRYEAPDCGCKMTNNFQADNCFCFFIPCDHRLHHFPGVVPLTGPSFCLLYSFVQPCNKTASFISHSWDTLWEGKIWDKQFVIILAEHGNNNKAGQLIQIIHFISSNTDNARKRNT